VSRPGKCNQILKRLHKLDKKKREPSPAASERVEEQFQYDIDKKISVGRCQNIMFTAISPSNCGLKMAASDDVWL